MPPFLRNLLAVVAGIVIGSIVNMAIVTVGPMLIPPPEGVDLSNPERLAEAMSQLQPEHFLTPWLSHAVGTLVGAWVAAKLGISRKLMLAFIIGGFFLLGGITMIVLVGGPLWFILLDLLGAYLPMAYLGGWLAGATRRAS